MNTFLFSKPSNYWLFLTSQTAVSFLTHEIAYLVYFLWQLSTSCSKWPVISEFVSSVIQQTPLRLSSFCLKEVGLLSPKGWAGSSWDLAFLTMPLVCRSLFPQENSLFFFVVQNWRILSIPRSRILEQLDCGVKRHSYKEAAVDKGCVCRDWDYRAWSWGWGWGPGSNWEGESP